MAQKHLGARKGVGFLRILLYSLLALLLVAALLAAWFLFEMEKPLVELGRDIKVLGGQVDLPVTARDQKSGLSLITVTLKQGEKEEAVFTRHFPSQGWFSKAGPNEFSEKVVIKAKESGFTEGPAELTVEAHDHSLMGFFRGNRRAVTVPVTVDTTAPQVHLLGPKRSIQPGGSASVVYSVSETPARHGVRIGGVFFQGYPSQKPGVYVSLFALPWNAKEMGKPVVQVWDAAGNENSVKLDLVFKPRREKHDTIRLSDAFFEAKLPEFRQRYPEMKGTPLDQYLYVNRTVRKQNVAKVEDICSKSEPEQLWQDRFVRMPGAGRAGFADQRTYMYQGKGVDEQTHLGVDLASVARAEVKAANRGKVVFADYLGIFGNMVILDHGQGLFSLYAHLSDIVVPLGAVLEKEQLLGHSGISGMAGGDHLHYGMLVGGVFVTPVEWWDQRWIANNIMTVLDEEEP